MAVAVIDGISVYYVSLVGDDSIFDFLLPGAIQIVAYAVGDEISFSYVANEPTNTVSEITSTKRGAATAATATTGAEGSSSAAASSALGASASSASAATGKEGDVEKTSSSAASAS
jgi:hypothetical protein